MKRPDGITVIGIYLLVMLALGVLVICCAMIGLIVVVAEQAPDAGVAAFWLFSAMAVFLILSVANGVMGWGLLNLKEWSRWGTIVLAAISLLGFPILTIIGAVIIWYLLKPDVKAAFLPKEAETPVEEAE